MHLPGPRTHCLTSTPPYQERLATHTRVGGAVGIGDAKATPFTVNPLWGGSGRISGASSSPTRRYERHEVVGGTRSCTGPFDFFS